MAEKFLGQLNGKRIAILGLSFKPERRYVGSNLDTTNQGTPIKRPR